MTGTLTDGQKWEGLRQGLELARRRAAGGKATVEVVYGVTSLGESKAGAGRLLELARGHWGIEVGLHYVRDVALGEGGCRAGKGGAPQILAAVRNAVVHLLEEVR